MQDNRCSIPFTGVPQLHLYNNTISPCCKVASSPLEKGMGAITPQFIELRKAIIKNERSPQCNACWKVDDLNGLSFRKKYSHHLDSPLDWDNLDVNAQPTGIEIAFSNKCQLMCVYCSPTVSSMWEGEQERFIKFIRPSDKIKEKLDINEILDVNLLKIVQVTGGEPMLEDRCVEFLLNLPVDNNRQMSIVTNLSYGKAVFSTLESILDRHKNMYVLCSLDAVGENITRKHLNWDLWDRNFRQLVDNLQERRKLFPSVAIMIKHTMNIMNYMNARDIIEYALSFRKQGLMGVTFDINPIAYNQMTSMSSGKIDPTAKIVLNTEDAALLNARESSLIVQHNIYLDNVEFDPNLEKRTNEFLKEYLK